MHAKCCVRAGAQPVKHRGGGEDDQAVEERRNVHGRARERVQAQLRAAGAVRHRGATSACGRHVHSAAATTAAPALGSPCNNLCELSRPAAWLGRHVSACQQARPAIYHRADYVRRKADSHNAHNRLLPLPVLGCDGGKLLMSVPLDLLEVSDGRRACTSPPSPGRQCAFR